MSGPHPPFRPESDVYTAAGWRSYVNQEPPVKPTRLSMDEYHALDNAARAAYDERRRIHVMHFGVLPSADLERIHDHLWAQFQLNLYLPGGAVRIGAVLDGDAGLGKTTVARTFARKYEKYLMKVAAFNSPADRDRFIPVVHVSLNGVTTPRDLAAVVCRYFGITLRGRFSAQKLLEIVYEAVHAHGVTLFVIDDIHFLDHHAKQNRDVANALKALMNLTGATFLYVGINRERFDFFQNLGRGRSPISLTASRFIYEVLRPYSMADVGWNRLIVKLESHLVLLKHEPGTLAGLDAYLFDRTRGNVGDLMRLVQTAAFSAVGATERLDRTVLEQTQLV